jgi:hypothetical protein
LQCAGADISQTDNSKCYFHGYTLSGNRHDGRTVHRGSQKSVAFLNVSG